MEVLKQIFVGGAVALITGIINLSLDGKIDYRWVVSGFLGALFLSLAYRIYAGRPPFKKWRVTNGLDGKGLSSGSGSVEGKDIEGAWRFKAGVVDWAVYGPYIKSSLRKGKYRARFRIKVDDVGGENRPIIDIDVASASKDLGDKRLAGRILTPHDFKRADEYRIFSLDFDVLPDEGERELEMRIYSKGSGHVVTLDYVRLSKRLF